MAAVSKQVELGGLENPLEEEAEIEAGYIWREAIYSAMRQFVSSYIANGQKGYDAVAAALDKRWGPKGRAVSASALRSALNDVERNNFRLEWADWFAARSPEIADLMARRVKPAKTAEERMTSIASARSCGPESAPRIRATSPSSSSAIACSCRPPERARAPRSSSAR